ncbi:hypothetical protein [Actinacidiphila glaucinigra]|uniref:hypothetical protein n=1 Tax=Actinacidiphila glaucinigra TaxID=235986 RepID=UPI00366C15A0
MRHAHADWARTWPHVIPSVRHVEVIALKNAWRAEALDKRYRIATALTEHQADDDQCPTCKVPAPCPTSTALMTPTSRHTATRGQRVTLPLRMRDIYTAVTELTSAPAPAGDATKKIQPPPPETR